MTWEEIKRNYPDQWVSLMDIDYEENSDVKSGIVVAVGQDLKSVALKSKGQKFTSHQFKFTGVVKNFLGFAKWDITNALAN
jgi:hypothetical protein